MLQIGSSQQVKSVKDVKAIEHTCEKIVQQDYDSMVTLSIYQNCVEVAESYSNRTFQFFHIASLVYAKRIRKGICIIVVERKTKRLMCSMIELPLGTPVAKQEAVIAAFNAARLGKPLPTAESFGFGEEVAGDGDGDGYLAPRQEGFGFGDEPEGEGDGYLAPRKEALESAEYLAPLPEARKQEMEDLYLTLETVPADTGFAQDLGEYITVEEAAKMPAGPPPYLIPSRIGAGPLVSLIAQDRAVPKGSKKLTCMYTGSIHVFPPFKPPPVSVNDVGKMVQVRGYDCVGTLEYFGKNKEKGGMCCGVVLQQPLGDMSSTHAGYFACEEKHGLLVSRDQVKVKTEFLPTWADTVKDAVTRIYALQLDSPKVQIVALPEAVEIRSSNGKDVVYSALPNHIAYLSTFGEDKLMAMVVLDPMDGQLYCRVLFNKSAGPIKAIMSACEESRESAKTRGEIFPDYSSLQMDDVDDVYYNYQASGGNYYNSTGSHAVKKRVSSLVQNKDTGVVEHESAAIFEAVYIGLETFSSAVIRGKPRAEKKRITDEAVVRIRKKAESHDPVCVQVGNEGIRVIDALSEEAAIAIVYEDIRFTTVSGEKADLFALHAKDNALGTVLCHVFACVGERATELAECISKTFVGYQLRISTDPFKAGGSRLKAPDTLFKRQVHRSDLKADKAIGAGQFGQVYLAVQTVAAGTSTRAVKMLRGGASIADRDEFIQEAEVMLKLDHPGLCEMIGVCVQQAPWLMVLEFLEYGDMRTVVKACQSKGLVMNLSEQLQWLVDVSGGMQYMEEHRLIHTDLAARNCLIGAGNLCKVADFGMTVQLAPKASSFEVDVSAKLPIKWCAIETLNDRMISSASDVWAYGILCWEVFEYGQMPYPGLPTSQVARRVNDGTRLKQANGCPKEVWALILTCWSSVPSDRPKFKNLNAELATHQRGINTGRTPFRDLGAVLHGNDSVDAEASAGTGKGKGRSSVVAAPEENEYAYSAVPDKRMEGRASTRRESKPHDVQQVVEAPADEGAAPQGGAYTMFTDEYGDEIDLMCGTGDHAAEAGSGGDGEAAKSTEWGALRASLPSFAGLEADDEPQTF